MSNENRTSAVIEPDRYELRERPVHHFELQRRTFFKAVGGGIAILVALQHPVAAQESGARGHGEDVPQNISAWLHIGEDGTVTVFTGKVEVGQNARTSLSQAVADELRVPFESVALVMGDTSLCPYDMGTFGSRTTPYMAPQLRRAAAAGRDVIVGIAAQKWNVDRSRLVAENGKVRDPQTGRVASFAELAKGRQFTQTIPADADPTFADHWTIAGKSEPKVDGRDFVTGRHRYTSDLQRPGMLYGRIVRPAAFGATLISADATAAKMMSGVVVVIDGDFVGVAAPTELEAARAAASVDAKWKTAPQPSGKDIFEYLKSHPGEPLEYDRGSGGIAKGSIDAGLAAADHRLSATFTTAYIAHAPLEPRAAVAEWNGDELTVWTGTQRPFGVRPELARAFNVPEAKVHVMVPDTGSAYGGKHTGECAVEAARLARAAKRPVKLVWTREEEFTWAYFRPAARIEITSGAKSDGTITGWEYHNYNSGTAGIGTPYDIANQKIQFHSAQSPLRQGSYRSLAAAANHFARESHMDELALEVKLDPLDFRRRNLKDPRLLAVFEAAAKAFGWPGGNKSTGQGFGIGGGVEKGGYVATCAEVRVDPKTGDVHVERLVTAFECGAIVNPDQLRNQVEGAMVMGLGGALFEAIEFENGRIINPHFAEYRVPRFGDIPKIEVVLVDRTDLPSAGAGETPIVGTAPAVANAIFDATGIRLRSMPLVPNGLKIPAS